MRIIMVKGFSKTGKTTTVTELVKALRRRGYTVGTIKDIHYDGFAADTPGTDTAKHADAGSLRVTALGQRDTAIILPRRIDLSALLKHYKEDFVIIEGEGDWGAEYPAILTAKTEDDVKKRMSDNVFAISGIFAGNNKECASYKNLPVVNCLDEIERMADMVEKATEKKREELEVVLTIDGNDIPLVPFVQKTLRNVVIGAVKALDGYEEGAEISITVK